MKFDAALPPIGLKDVPAIAKAAERYAAFLGVSLSESERSLS